MLHQFIPGCKNGDIALAFSIFQHFSFNPNAYFHCDKLTRTSGLIEACTNGRTELLSLLLKDPRINVNIENNCGSTGFISACNHRHTAIVSLLLKDPRVDVNKRDIYGRTGFFLSCHNDFLEIVSLLLRDQRIDASERFSYACSHIQTEPVSYLLQSSQFFVDGCFSLCLFKWTNWNHLDNVAALTCRSAWQIPRRLLCWWPNNGEISLE